MKTRIKAGIMALALTAATAVGAQQLQYISGQSVAPFFEGWEQNPDGSFDMVFGYLNRNYREELNIPIGPDNSIEPASFAQAQPTYFYPRRHRYMFRVRVPKDWGKKDVTWSLTTNGKTEKAYGYLVPEQAIDNEVITHNRGGAGVIKPPTIALEGSAERSVAVGQPLSLTVKVASQDPPRAPRKGPTPTADAGRGTPPVGNLIADGAVNPDDGRGRGRVAQSDEPGVGVDVDGSGRKLLAVGRFARGQASGLRVAWIQWRGPGKITFDPWFMEGVDDRMPGWQLPPMAADGRVTTNAKFSQPGTYVVRAMADTGGLFTPLDITVNVTAAPSTAGR
jgi:hypothetical protein